jgi:hypothetical protein
VRRHLIPSFALVTALGVGYHPPRPACAPSALVDTTGWRRVTAQGAPVSFRFPAGFVADTYQAWAPHEGGQSWTDGQIHFGYAVAWYRAVDAVMSDEHVCRMTVGGLPATVYWVQTKKETRIAAHWITAHKMVRSVAAVGGSNNPGALPMLWTLLRLVRADSSVLRPF